MSTDQQVILIDRSVLSAARVFETQRTVLPEYPQNPLIELVAIKNSQKWAKERGAIIALAWAAVSGNLVVRASPFSFEEGLRVARYPDIPSQVDIFSCLGVPNKEWALPASPLSRLLGLYADLTSEPPEEQARKYKQRLSMLTQPGVIKALTQKASQYGCTEFDLLCLEELEPVVKKLGSDVTHIVDVLQLWTAHINGIPLFATLDSTFIRLMTQSIKNPWRAKPLLPSDICSALAIKHHPFGPLDETETYPILGGALKKMLRLHVGQNDDGDQK